jgi:hypothetical protein
MFGRRFVDVYLNDHRAGATAGLALARRCLHNNEGSRVGAALRDITTEIEDDAETLDEIASFLSVKPDPVKRLFARVGELMSRAKLNGRLTRYSPLSRLLELEALMAGTEAKRQLWLSLDAGPVGESLAAFDLQRLVKRAADQHARLAVHHDLAAAEALVLIGRNAS